MSRTVTIATPYCEIRPVPRRVTCLPMIARSYALTLAVSLIVSLGAPVPPWGASARAGSALTVVHRPPDAAREGEDLRLTGALAETAARGGEVYYRPPGGEYSAVPLVREGDHWAAYLPGEDLHPPAVQYFVRMETPDGREATYPREGADRSPVVVRVEPRAGRLIVVSPEPGEPVTAGSPEIAALFDPPLPTIDGLLVLLDRRDVTAIADLSDESLFLTPPEPLDPGEHELRVFYIEESGKTGEARWPFTAISEGPRAGPAVTLHGRWEGGWAGVDAGGGGAVMGVPFPQRSGAVVNLLAQGSVGSEETSCSVNRDPIYEGTTRWLVRLDGNAHDLEAGDVQPFLSEETVAWFSARGLAGRFRKGAYSTRLVALRTEEADTSLGIGIYSQYLVGIGQEVRRGSVRTGLTAAYGFDDKGSLPRASGVASDSTATAPLTLLALPPIRNWVGAWETRIERGRLAWRGSLSWSSLDSDARRRARAYCLGSELRGGRGFVSLEFRSRRPGYFALGSPSLNSGEEGLFVDARLEGGRRWRSNARFEIYRDYEPTEPFSGRRPVTELWWRHEIDSVHLLGGLSSFLILHLYHVPYAGFPLHNDDLTVGVSDAHGPLTGSLSLRYGQTEREGRIGLWTLNGSAWYRPAGGGLDLRLRARWERSYDDLDKLDYRRPGWGIEARYHWPQLEARASYEWLRRDDLRDDAQDYTEQLYSLSLGRAF